MNSLPAERTAPFRHHASVLILSALLALAGCGDETRPGPPRMVHLDRPVTSLTVCPESNSVVVAFLRGNPTALDLATRAVTRIPPTSLEREDAGGPRREPVALAPDLGLVARGGVEEVRVLRSGDLSPVRSLKLREPDPFGEGPGPVTSAPIGPNRVSALAYLPWSQTLLVGSSYGLESMRIDGSEAPVPHEGIHRILTCIEVFPESRRAFAGDARGSIYAIDADGRVELMAEAAHERFVTVLARSPKGDLLLSGGLDGKVCFWPVR